MMLAIQTAIRDRLLAYVPLTAQLAVAPEGGPAVYDHVPQPDDGGRGDAFPYVGVGDDTAIEWDADDSIGLEATVTLHTWSRYRGRAQCKSIQAAIKAALHRYDLPVASARTVLVNFDFEESLVEADGQTRHGVSRFRIIAEEEDIESS